MKVMVTGADGFVGHHLVQALITQTKAQVVAVCGPGSKTSSDRGDRERVRYAQADLRHPQSLRPLIREHRPDQMYHLAGIAVTHSTSYEAYETVNVRGTFEWANVVLEEMGGDCKFLFISSSAVYGTLPQDRESFTEADALKPTSLYGASKANAETCLHTLAAKGLDLRIARPFNHTGAGQQGGFLCPDVAERIAKAMRETTTGLLRIASGRLDGVRDFLDVRDVVNAYIRMQYTCPSGTICNVSSGVGVTVGEVCRVLAQVASDGREVSFSEAAELLRTSDRVVGNSDLLRSLTDWSPRYSLRDALTALWEGLADPHN